MGKFIDQLGQAGIGMASQAAGGLMGLMFAGANDRRQIKMQQQLQQMQIAGQKELTDYNYGKQMQMWNDTNYWAQMEHLKKAGLNPALIYGMGGGGGQSTNINPGQIQGGHAPTGGGEAIAGMGMGLNLALMKAQKDLMEAQARKTNVEADKTEGVDTQKTQSEIQAIGAGIENTKAATELTKVNTKIANISEWIQGESAPDAVRIINKQADKLEGEIESISLHNKLTKATMNDQIKLVRQQLTTVYLEQQLTKEQTQLTKLTQATEAEKPALIKEQARQITHAIKQKWEELRIDESRMTDEQRTRVNQQITNDVAESEKIPFDIVQGAINILLLKGIFGKNEQERVEVKSHRGRMEPPIIRY